MKLTKKQKREIIEKIDNEGFDYYFRYYISRKKEYADKDFLKLVNKYCKVADKIELYLRKQD